MKNKLWKRPGLTPRDRSIVTVATLIARNQAGEMPRHIAFALDNGVKPAEISEIITHLAFYSGWGNAMSAVAAAEDVFTQRGIGADQLTIHADRGSSMTSKPVAFLLTDLGVTQSHSRPHVSDDNPFSESQFKTLKYRPDFPGQFGSIAAARSVRATPSMLAVKPTRQSESGHRTRSTMPPASRGLCRAATRQNRRGGVMSAAAGAAQRPPTRRRASDRCGW